MFAAYFIEMSRNIHTCSFLFLLIFASSCATIVGGSKYYANITVDDHSDAYIYYNEAIAGKGYASIKIPRNEIDELVFTVKKEGCDDQNFAYVSKRVRGWALANSILFFTSAAPFPIPYGALIDFAFGSIYKPDIRERGIIKNDFRHYNYILDYTGCDASKPVIVKKSEFSVEERLKELKLLFEQGLISEEEYNEQRKKILEEI